MKEARWWKGRVMSLRSVRLKSAASAVAGAALAAGAGTAAALAPGAANATAAADTVQCQVAYSANDWGSGFGASVVIKNVGTTAWSSWTLGYSYAGNQTLHSGWNGSWAQSGKNVTVTSLSWNGAVAA